LCGAQVFSELLGKYLLYSFDRSIEPLHTAGVVIIISRATATAAAAKTVLGGFLTKA